MRLQGWHLVVLLVVILLLFGAKRLPDLARSVGQSLKILKTEVKDLTDDDKSAKASGTNPTTTAQPTTDPATRPQATTSPPDDGAPGPRA